MRGWHYLFVPAQVLVNLVTMCKVKEITMISNAGYFADTPDLLRAPVSCRTSPAVY